MIKLTIDPDYSPTVRRFDKKTILLGNFSDQADVYLPNENGSSSKLQISKEETGYLAKNIANDPFTLINGVPFGKKKLQSGDRIQIDETILLFEAEAPQSDIEHLFRQVEQLVEEEEENNGPEEEISESPQDAGSNSLDKKESKNLKSRVILFLFAIAFVLLIVIGTMSLTYQQVRGKVRDQEKKAAIAVADITMAITHAKINQIQPRKQNWSSPEFLSNLFQTVISERYLPTLTENLDNQLHQTSYILRTFTNSDLSRFLIIAQPIPSLMHWWIPRSALVVDTQSMVIRKVADLKALNRLLTVPQPLEGKNGEAVIKFINEGKIISLSSLSNDRSSEGFSPPVALSMIRPGAENLIYNAPRYHPFSESVLAHALQLMTHSCTSGEVKVFNDKIQALSNLQDLILYSSKGMQHAIQSQKALQTFSPEKKFLIAYLKHSPNGKELTGNLLISDDQSASFDETNEALADAENLIDQITYPYPAPAQNLIPKPSKEQKSELNRSHPFYLRLIAIKATREQALQPISMQLNYLLTHYNKEIDPEFFSEFTKVFNEYNAADLQAQSLMLKEIKELYNDYAAIPLESLMEYLKETHLDEFVREHLKDKIEGVKQTKVTKEEIEYQLQRIQHATYLEELEHLVDEMAALLVIERHPNPEQLIECQRQTKAVVQDRLADFLLSPQSRIPLESFSEENEPVLLNIMEKSWIFDPNEVEFFLSEFRNLAKGQLIDD